MGRGQDSLELKEEIGELCREIDYFEPAVYKGRHIIVFRQVAVFDSMGLLRLRVRLSV